MTDTAPERIWALADRRKHWQEEKPRDGEHTGHWTEYVRVSALPPQEVSVQEAAKVLLGDAVALRTMATAARGSRASCMETPSYPPLFELLDFSGENKTVIVVNAAIDAALRALSEGKT